MNPFEDTFFKYLTEASGLSRLSLRLGNRSLIKCVDLSQTIANNPKGSLRLDGLAVMARMLHPIPSRTRT